MKKEETTVSLKDRKNMRYFLAVLAVVAIGVTMWMCTHNVAEPDGEDSNCVIAGQLDSLFSTIFTSDTEPGGYALLIKDDTVVYRYVRGLANLDTKEAIDENTRFNFTSGSKIFAAASLLMLAEWGLTSLDDSLSLYFPEFSEDFFKQITIRDILTHSSGLPDLRPTESSEWSNYIKDNASVFANSEDYRLYGTSEEYIKCFKSIRELHYKPGKHYSRNDAAYVLVAPLVERISGEPYDIWVRENIFRRAGVENICYINPGAPVPAGAHGYRRVNPTTSAKTTFKSADGKWEEYDYGEAPFFITKADRGAFITPAEFVKWKRAYYGGKVLNDTSFNAIFNTYIPTSRPNVSFGLGCALYNPEGSPMCEYHLDRNGGFTSIEGSFPDKNLHYLVLSNRNDWDFYHVTDELRRLLKLADYFDSKAAL